MSMPIPKPLKKDLTHGVWQKISKLEAARRQIDTAIKIYFASGDAVSVHTLGSAALGIIDNLLVRSGQPVTMPLDDVRPEYRKAFQEMRNEDANFFKHADRDPEAILQFKVSGTTPYR